MDIMQHIRSTTRSLQSFYHCLPTSWFIVLLHMFHLLQSLNQNQDASTLTVAHVDPVFVIGANSCGTI